MSLNDPPPEFTGGIALTGPQDALKRPFTWSVPRWRNW